MGVLNDLLLDLLKRTTAYVARTVTCMLLWFDNHTVMFRVTPSFIAAQHQHRICDASASHRDASASHRARPLLSPRMCS